MLLRFRNTYKTRKIMLIYSAISMITIVMASFAFMLSFIFNHWWLYLLLIICLSAFFFSFFLLVLENNNYKLKYYYNKKKFNTLYNEIIYKYNIESNKNKRKIKKEAKDQFYQYGEISVRYTEIETIVFADWLEKHSYDLYINGNVEDKLSYFLYGLLGVVGLYGNYRISVSNLINIYNKEEIKQLLDGCSFIKESFKDKCMFMYDHSSFVSEEFLKNMYLELIYIVEVIIGLINEEEFNSLMYNPSYYYSEDKCIVYQINKENNKFVVLEKDLQYHYIVKLEETYESEEEALSIVKQCLKNIDIEKRNK